MIDEKKLIEKLKERERTHMCDFNVFDDAPEAQFDIAHCLQELQEVMDIVRKQPKVGEWIPCSERLPLEEYRNDIEARGEDAVYPVLVTKKVLSYEANDMISVTGQAWFCKHGGKYNFFDKDMGVIDVIAWMPLPEPYNAERGGKNE